MAFCQLWLQSRKTSAAAFEGVALASPWYLPRPHRLFLLGFETAMWHVLGRPQNPQRLYKLFLLGFETAMWHVLGKPQQPQNFRSSFRRPSSLTTLRSSSAAFEGVPLAWPWYLPRPHKLFLLGFETAMWHVLGRPASKLPCGTFWASPNSLKTSAAAFEGLRTSQPSAAAQQLSKASRLLGHGTSLGPTSCFYWASKLPCGTFWAGPKTFKTSAAAQQLSKASHLLGHGTSLGPTSCFYWASKLPCGTFWAGPKTLKTSAAAFEGLRTSQPSAAAQQLSKASRLLGHGTSLGPTSCFY